MNPNAPWEHGHGPHGWGGEQLFFLPFLGLLTFALVLFSLLALAYLLRSGKIDLSRFGRPRPEDEAKRVLAARFAQGDLSPEEFMERSSLLNWTPGVDAAAPRLGRFRRR